MYHVKRIDRRRGSILIAVLTSLAFFLCQANAGNIPVSFAGGNNFPGNMFDVVTVGKSLNVTGFDINVGKQNSVVSIAVYYRLGSFAGHESDPSAWILAGTAKTVSQGIGNHTFVDVPDFELANYSIYGIYITIESAAFGQNHYQFRTGSKVFSNADLQTNGGIGLGSQNGLSKRDRTWNGTMYYELAMTPAPVPSGVMLAGIGFLCLAGYTSFRRKTVVENDLNQSVMNCSE